MAPGGPQRPPRGLKAPGAADFWTPAMFPRLRSSARSPGQLSQLRGTSRPTSTPDRLDPVEGRNQMLAFHLRAQVAMHVAEGPDGNGGS